MGFGLGIEGVDCLFESRSRLAVLGPSPPPPFRPGVRASRPASWDPGFPPLARLVFSSQHLNLLLLLRILQAFSLQEAKGQTSPQASGVHAFRGPGARARSQGPDFQPPCFQGLSGGQGPGPLWVFFQDMILSLHLLFLADCINIHIFRI